MSAGVLRRAWTGLRWYLREAAVEARWDEYVDRCRREGREPVPRREFERHRAEQRARPGVALLLTSAARVRAQPAVSRSRTAWAAAAARVSDSAPADASWT